MTPCTNNYQCHPRTKLAIYSSLNPPDLKFRPIIAGPICPTSNLSTMLDEMLKPLLPQIKSYIRDDHDFLQKLNRNITDSMIFASFDVESLYTNIDHHLGKTAIAYWIDKCADKLPSRFNKNLILEAVDIVLKCYTIFFDGDLSN